ncbi:hypothetical protein J7T55_005964 [Diaporthe amygdali]|uniref:uncharacterized protein n=1 Tax=Phomopsis amygdali TaxID=1214568 RepID=UPI0022FE3C68|nr:uncharacterized protein J7T55_005964 [Diaporthe amygdali]KAJ0124625.1 hypothetical protein J7T55_005964 [Diaporthe amygdali]
MAAAQCAVAMPYDNMPALAAEHNSEWPFSELIRESPFEHHRRAHEFSASKALAPCASETPTGMGPTVSPDTAAAFSASTAFKNSATTYGVSNASFIISVVNDDDSFEYAENRFHGWINQATYSPYNCQLACNALNATGIKCNTYNTYFLRSPSITPSTDTSCPNPPSMTTIVCALWKNKLYPWDGINTGEVRGRNFTVVIAGSNLYQRNNSETL